MVAMEAQLLRQGHSFLLLQVTDNYLHPHPQCDIQIRQFQFSIILLLFEESTNQSWMREIGV